MTVRMGIGAVAAIGASPSPSGTVIAAFDRAVYVRFPGGIVAVTGPGVAPGPLHVSSSVDLSALAVGDTFVPPAGWRDPVVWRGELPDRASIGADLSGRPALVALLAPVARQSALLREPLVYRWRHATRQADMAECCRLLGGLGPGLTPSGDDALAGMFLATRLFEPDREAELVARAAQVETHEIARAFLIWAARGQSIEPVHRLLAGDATAAADLLAFGHTSGADLALGLQFGLRPRLGEV